MSHGGMHVVLRGFEYGPEGITTTIRIVTSCLHRLFTIIYALLIISMFLWFLLAILPAPGELPG
jgi:small neutral amino acid transporter SnatA (MarC family)